LPVTTTFHVQSPGGVNEDVTCTLSDAEVAILSAFISYVADVESLKIVQNPPPGSVSIHIEENGRSIVSSDGPSWESVLPLLHRLRPIILENEHASFSTVSSLLGKAVPSVAFRRLLKFAREIYDGRQQQKLMRFSSHETTLNSESVLMKWLNAYEYHRDQTLKAEVDALLSMLPEALQQMIFISMLFQKVRAAQALAGIAELALGKRTTFTARLPSKPPVA
jgi:hypothetical protein